MNRLIINDAFFQLEDQNQLLIQEILASKSYKNYLLARKQMNDCLEVAKLKKTFQTEKDKFERIAAYGEYAPDYRQQQRKVRISKRALDLNEKVAAFRLAETDFQQLLDEIGIRLAQVISSEIKVDAGNPFLKQGIIVVRGIVMDNTEFVMQKRRGIIVWVYSLKQLKTLKRFGLIHFVSRKMKYVVLYVNEEVVDETEEKLQGLHFVRQVERSYRPDIEMNFADRIGTKAAYQVKDDDELDVVEANTKIRLAETV